MGVPPSHILRMTHPEDDQCPPFRIKVIGSYKDCLTRQVSEALKIHNSKDELLNSKNEYASNHLSRIMVDMDSVSREKAGSERGRGRKAGCQKAGKLQSCQDETKKIPPSNQQPREPGYKHHSLETTWIWVAGSAMHRQDV